MLSNMIESVQVTISSLIEKLYFQKEDMTLQT